MPVLPLAEAISRALTSTQTLTTATSVVKELVENALDARATSISVEITANTLDKIIIRDDGCGIGVQDRQLLCKRGCTSKITSLDDLAVLGGTYLGFRGTALASIAEMSKEVTIVTKVEGEQPATTMTFGPGGKLLSSASASHNNGTTVRVESFLSSIPVRRQVVLKNPAKVLDEIKKLLQSHALARLNIKITLKVLKAKGNKHNWSFAVHNGEDPLLAAASQVAGREIISYSRRISVPRSEDQHDSYGLEALLLDAKDKDISRFANVGQFLSVDGRVVNQEKGIMKEISKSYKAHLLQIVAPNTSVPSKPFLVLHFICPAGSYDVNVEPAKDVVLFHDQPKIFKLAEKAFVEFYGELSQPSIAKSGLESQRQSFDPNSFNILLARSKPDDSRQPTLAADIVGGNLHISEPPVPEAKTNARSLVDTFAEAITRSDTSLPPHQSPTACRVEHLSSLGATVRRTPVGLHDENTHEFDSDVEDPIGETEVYDPTNVHLNNPFTRAKLTSIQRSEYDSAKITEHQVSTSGSVQVGPKFLLSNITPSKSNQGPVPLMYRPPSPATSPSSERAQTYQNPGPPFPRRSRRAREEEDEDADLQQRSGTEDMVNQPSTSHRTKPSAWSQSPLLQTPVRSPVRQACVDRAPVSLGKHSTSSFTTIAQGDSGPPRNVLRKHNEPFRPPFKKSATSNSPLSGEIEHLTLDFPLEDDGLRTISPDFGNTRGDGDLQNILEFERQKHFINQQAKRNQSLLDPNDLARIQRATSEEAQILSDEAVQDRVRDLSATSSNISFQPSSTNTILENSVEPLLKHNSMARANPYQNRYLAAVRGLNPQYSDHSVTAKHPPIKQHTIPPSQAHQPLSFTKADPRSYFISLQRSSRNLFDYGNANHRHDQNAKKVSRAKSNNRLPFETIPIDSVKFDQSATPSEQFVSLQKLTEMGISLAIHDPYIKTGSIEPAMEKSTTETSDADLPWQTTLEQLITENYVRDPVQG